MTTTTPSIEVPQTGEARRVQPRTGWLRWWVVLLALGAVATAAAGIVHWFPGGSNLDVDAFTVTRRNFTIALHEKGELKAAKSIDVKCEVEGRSNIIWLIPEGTEVAEGDLLVKLASEQIDDRVRSEEIKEANAKASTEAAAQEYDITLDEQASLVRKAELALRNAEIELEKYTEGDWVQQETDADLDIERGEEIHREKTAELQDAREMFEQYRFSFDLTRRDELHAERPGPELLKTFADQGMVLSAAATVAPDGETADKWRIIDTDRRYNARVEDGELRVYYERNFINKRDLQTAEFALLEAKIGLRKAKLKREILHKYTHPKDAQQKESDVAEANKDLARARKSAEAKIAQRLANKEAKAAEYEFTRQQLEKFRRQQAKTEIRAPAPGLVVYDTGRNRWDRRQIAEGTEVYERQTIIKLPDTEVMQALVRVHEGKANKVQVDQQARIEIEGMPGVVIEGRVSKIAPLADSQNQWLNPELKEYETEITLSTNGYDLKPGVTARVEILVDEVRDVLAVPVQSVVTKQGRRHVFRGRAPEPVQVELGRSNDEFVEVIDGLAEGDTIRLSVSDEDLQRIPELASEEQSPSNGDGVANREQTPKPASKGHRPAHRRGGQGRRGSGGARPTAG